MNITETVIREINSDPFLPWLPNLTEMLVLAASKQMLTKTQLELLEYSSSMFLYNTAPTLRIPLSTIIKKNHYLSVALESIPDSYLLELSSIGIDPVDLDKAHTIAIIDAINMAYSYIATDPSLFDTINWLIRSVHIIGTADPDTDISYSNPAIPFSIFVSVPDMKFPNAVERLAESIIHEAMHLQLTLIENFLPLVSNERTEFFSPWKGSNRSARGILHAIYVFCSIRAGLSRLTTERNAYIKSRTSQITKEMILVKDFPFEQSLTPEGQLLLRKLIAAA
ncbi:MAG: HEXXH motif-containing putative peptide modification protein [Pseudohongiella sp.]|nr:HEXXH motif-containing putative peptide modification protein [Pseudohongiella sp.]